MTHEAHASAGPRGPVLAMVALGLLALLVPAFLVEVPPVLDYPNHLARMGLIAGGAEQAPLSAMYAVDWSRAWTNIGVDLLARWLGPALGAERLGPAVLALSVALPPLGAVLLHRTGFGGWHWWQAGFAALGWTLTAVLGFLNFQLGVGLALLLAAADPWLLRRGAPVVWTARIAFGAGLLAMHLFAPFFYAALLGGLALGRTPLPSRDLRTAAGRLLRAALPGLAALAPVALVLLLAPSAPSGDPDGLPFVAWEPWWARPGALLSPLTGYGLRFDAPVIFAGLFVLLLAIGRKRLGVHPGLLTAAGALAVLALLMPSKLGDTFYIDHRLPLMALLTAVTAVRPDVALSRRDAALAGLALLAVGLYRTGAVAHAWIARQPDVAAVRRALTDVPPGAAVLPLAHLPPDADVRRAPVARFADAPLFWHLPALLVTERRAFTPTLFTAAGKQPVRVAPPWTDIDAPNAPIVSVQLLAARPEDIPARIDYMRAWRKRFDYVLVLNADMPDGEGAPPRPPELQLVSDQGFAQLYRVRRAP